MCVCVHTGPVTLMIEQIRRRYLFLENGKQQANGISRRSIAPRICSTLCFSFEICAPSTQSKRKRKIKKKENEMLRNRNENAFSNSYKKLKTKLASHPIALHSPIKLMPMVLFKHFRYILLGH